MNAESNDRETEAQRILARVQREASADGASRFERVASRAIDHMKGADADQGDWAEVWGLRIGRIFSLVALVVLSAWLFLFLTRGG